MNLSNNIYTYRVSKNWSQSELADMLGVSRQSVSKWENGAATPDLDKLIKMKELYDVTLDELVFGDGVQSKKNDPENRAQSETTGSKKRMVAGMVMLIFGLVFFLLSIFFGNQLYFGEAFGELLSSTIVLVSISVLFTYDFRALAVCASSFFLYCVLCFGFLHLSSLTNYLFTFLFSVIIIVWFIICGEHANKGAKQDWTSSAVPDGEELK